MGKYQIMRRDPTTGETSRWTSNDHRKASLAARYDHEQRGQYVTVIRADSGNVVIWFGQDMSAEMKQANEQQ